MLQETTGGYFKMVTWSRMSTPAGKGALQDVLFLLICRFEETMFSVIWLLLSMYLTAQQGLFFLFRLRNSYIVFLATINPISDHS